MSDAMVLPHGYKLLKDSTFDERSWPEDKELENGSYYCNCCTCLRQFMGHKRRVLCRVCDAESVNPHLYVSSERHTKEAARWRWWRSWWTNDDDDMEVINNVRRYDGPDDFDEAVDEAMTRFPISWGDSK